MAEATGPLPSSFRYQIPNTEEGAVYQQPVDSKVTGPLPSNFRYQIPNTEEEQYSETQSSKSYIPFYDSLQHSGLVEDEQAWRESDSDDRQAITSDMVKSNEVWIDAAKTIYKDEEERDFGGTDEEAAEWLLDRQAKYNWDITDLALTSAASGDWDDKTKQAWLDSMNIYDAMDSDASTWGNSIYHTVTDPTFLPSLIFGVGIGAVVKTLGGKGAALAGKFAFKQALKNSLLKEGLRKGLSTKAATAVAEKASKGGGKAALSVLGKESVLAARKEAAKGVARRQGLTAAGAGAVYGATDDVLRQSIERDIDPEYEYSPLRTIISGGIGGIAGGAIGAGIPRLGELVGRGRIHRATPPAKGEYGEEEIISKSLKDAKDTVSIEAVIDDGADRVAVDGTLVLSAGKKSPEEINTIKEKLLLKFKDVEVSRASGEAVFGASKKILPDETEISRISKEMGLAPQKTFASNILARVNRNISSTAGLDKELGKASIDMSNNLEKTKGLIGIASKKLHRALKGDLKRNTGSKRLDKLDEIDDGLSAAEGGRVALETVTKAFRGDRVAIDKLTTQGFKGTLRAVQDLRRSINEHQKQLLDTGQIPSRLVRKKIESEKEAELVRQETKNKNVKVGDTVEFETNKLRIKLEKSIGDADDPLKKGGDDIDLYITRSYELFDNPKWSKFIRETSEGQQLHSRAVDHIASKLGSEGGLNKSDANKRAVEYVEDLLSRGLDGEDKAAFLAETFTNTKNNKALSIFKSKKDIDAPIRALMGELTDPRSVVADTLWKINSDLETFKFQKAIRDAAESGRVEGLTVGRRQGEMQLPLLNQSPISQRPNVRPTRLEGLPVSGDIAQPLRDVFATPALKNALEMGNEIGPITSNVWKKFVFLQGMARSAKTVYSESAWARNFITAGMMSLANGNLNPVGLMEFRHVIGGLVNEGNEAIERNLVKMRALGLHQSGIDVGAFKAVVEETSDGRFWREGNKNFLNANKPTKKIRNAATKFQTTAANIYQSADDLWKHHSFYNEKKKYRKVLEDKGINPDEVVRETITSTGERIGITRLDDYAADVVKDTMQNYAQVSRAVRFLRRMPFADFVAYKSEMFRTAKGTLKTAFRDIGEGMEDMRTSRGLRGNKQFRVGMFRLGSATAAAGSIPAMGYTSAELAGMNEYEVLNTGEEAPYTKAEGIKIATDREWDAGAHWLWLGGESKGEGKRINLSWLNPWQPFIGPLTAAYRELAEGKYPDPTLLNVADELFAKPFKETFGTSMVADALMGILNNTDRYGRPLSGKDDDIGDQTRNTLGRLWQAFEPGIYRDVNRMVQSYNTRGKSAIPDSPGVTRSGGKLIPTDQWIAMAGIKPEVYDVKKSLRFKFSNLSARYKDINNLRSLLADHRPTNQQDYVDVYTKELDTQFKIAREMNKLFEAGLSSGLSQSDIVLAITGKGFFKSAFTKQIQALFARDESKRGIFLPSKPPFVFGVKMAKIIEDQTGVPVDRSLLYQEISKVYSDYTGRPLY